MVVFLFLVAHSSVEECKITSTIDTNGNVKVTNGEVICFYVILQCPSENIEKKTLLI